MYFNKEYVPIFVLISLFALSSWINASAVWAELPLMVNILPEQWSLPSYVAIVVQVSNIAPALYSIISKVKSMKSGRSVSEHDITLSLLIICISLLSVFLMAFFWDDTSFIAGQERSIALLCLVSIFSLASCTSSMVYLPFMARYPVAYLSIFYFGCGLSGLIPGILGLTQGRGGNPTCINSTTISNISCDINPASNISISHLIPVYPDPKFSIQTFFLIIFGILLTSLFSFCALNFTRLKSYQVLHKENIVPNMRNNPETEAIVTTNNSKDTKSESVTLDVSEDTNSVEYSLKANSTSSRPKSQIKKSHLVFHLVSTLILNASINGIIPSIQSYTCMPYGNLVYTLTVRLSSVMGSLSSLSTLFLPVPSIKVIGVLMSIGITTVVFQFTVALMSPSPPLVGTIYGQIMIICSSLLLTMSFSLARVWIASKLHSSGGRKLLVLCGGVTQLGSFIGAFVAFILVNWFGIFHSMPPCLGDDIH